MKSSLLIGCCCSETAKFTSLTFSTDAEWTETSHSALFPSLVVLWFWDLLKFKSCHFEAGLCIFVVVFPLFVVVFRLCGFWSFLCVCVFMEVFRLFVNRVGYQETGANMAPIPTQLADGITAHISVSLNWQSGWLCYLSSGAAKLMLLTYSSKLRYLLANFFLICEFF